MGLSLDSAKTECMHFTRNTRSREHRTDVNIILPNALGPGNDFTVVPSKPLRWLGLWFDSKLLWTEHCSRMSNKAQSALAAMSILGNTIRGVTARYLRILYLGCVIPILTWGSELWYQGHKDGPRLRLVRRVERMGLLRVLGCWKPSPTALLHALAGCTPIETLIAQRQGEYACRRRW